MSIISISAAVGINAANRNPDVTKVQVLLNHFIGNRKLLGAKPLVIDGKCGSKTREAIMMLQIQNGLMSDEHLNGQIRPGGMTIAFMNKNAGYIPPDPGAKSDEEWEYYTRTKQYWGSLSETEKRWMAKPPAHEREAGMFKSNKRDGTRPLFHLAWKTSNPTRYCVGHGHPHDTGALHGWMEQETSLDSLRRKHNIEYTGMAAWAKAMGLDAGVQGIAAMNAGMNLLMFHYVMKHGRCIRNAEGQAKRDLRAEAKAIFEIVNAVVGGASGAKSPSKLTPVSDVRIDKFAEQIYKVATGDYGKSPGVEFGKDEVTYNEDIVDAGGRIVGKVKYFD